MINTLNVVLNETMRSLLSDEIRQLQEDLMQLTEENNSLQTQARNQIDFNEMFTRRADQQSAALRGMFSCLSEME